MLKPLMDNLATNQFEALLANSNDAIISKTTTGIITSWNPAAERLYGYKAHEVLGKSIDLIIPLTNPDEASHIMQQILCGEPIQRYETQRCHKDGHIIDISLAISPLKDPQGEVVGALSIAHDITERKQREEELSHRAERFKQFIDANIGGVLFSNEERVLEVNDAFLKLIGYSREEFEHQQLSWVHFTPPEGMASGQQALAELRSHGSCAPFEKEYMRKDGTRVPALVAAIRLQENPFLWMTFVIDLTAQKELERRKSELVTLASHELRTPLTSIKGYLEVLLGNTEMPFTASQRSYLEIIKRNTLRLIALINDLLDLSRLEAGMAQLRRRVLDLNGLMQEVAQNLQPLLQAKHQQLNISLLPSAPVVLGDPDRILQILTNLLSNAHKFTPQDGKIDLSLQQDLEGIRIAVQDSGIGMTPEEQAHLFTRFYRAHPFTKEEEGTGMGLAITRALIEMHGGTIEVESNSGKGSTFRFTLPIVREATVSTRRTPSRREEVKLILIVEDEPDHTNLVQHLLEQQNYDVLTTYRGKQVVALATQAQPDLIILDVTLPESNGLWVLEQLKCQEVTASIPVLLLTMSDIKEQGTLLGAIGVLGKPFSQEELQERVNAIVRAERQPLVLVATADPVSETFLYRGIKQAGYRVLEASNTDTLLQLIKYQRPNLVLLDADLLVQEIELLPRLMQNLATLHSSLLLLGDVPDALHERWSGWLTEGLVQAVGKPINMQDVMAVITQELTKGGRV